jgi:hypothetical protein
VYPLNYVIKREILEAGKSARRDFMREEGFRQEIRLRLLALVLALVLTWYAANPAPGPVHRGERDEEMPDEERLVMRSPVDMSDGLELPESRVTMSNVRSSSFESEMGIEDLEWPEIIDIK